jgi:hypothetical protein
MGRREIFLTFLLLVEIEGHFTNEFVSYVYETENWTALFGGSKITIFPDFFLCD